MSQLRIDSGGLLKLPLTICGQLGSKPLEPLSSSGGHLFLSRCNIEYPVLLTGVLGEISVPDLLSFFNMFRKTGVLNFEFDDGDKALYFQQGEIVFATSTFANEDLGEILFSLGKVERQSLHEAYQLVRGNITLGKLLVDKGIVTPKDLWLAARSQVETILFNLFNAQHGGFYFRAQSLDQEQLLRLSMSTQNIILEGLRRQDEKALYLRRLVSLDYFVVPTGQDAADLGQSEARMYNFSRGGRLNARDLFRKMGMREYDGMRILYSLVEKGLVRMEDAPAAEIEGDLGQVLKIYNSLLTAIFVRMVKANPGFPQEISLLLRDLPQPYSFVLRDVELLEDGSLDGHRIVSNLSGLEEGDKKKLLADALSELVYMETMAVRRDLGADQAQPLIARVQDITDRMRDIVGRN